MGAIGDETGADLRRKMVSAMKQGCVSFCMTSGPDFSASVSKFYASTGVTITNIVVEGNRCVVGLAWLV